MSSNISSETGEYIPKEGRSPRFTSWVFLMMCSVITLKSSAEVKNDMEEVNTAARWSVACSAISFAITSIVLLAHFVPAASSFMVGSKIEGFFTFVLMGFWTATVSMVTNADNNLSVVQSDINQVSNGNLYYFSWAGFVLSIILFVSYLRSAYGLELVDTLKERASRLTHWAGLLAASMVVMGSSTRVFIQDCNVDDNRTSNNQGEDDQELPFGYCTTTKYTIILGGVGVFLSLVVVAAKFLFTSSTPYALEVSIASLLTVLNTIGVTYITSNSGPGRAIGNLYYFSWISFILSAVIMSECFNVSKHAASHQQRQHAEESLDYNSETQNNIKDMSLEDI